MRGPLALSLAAIAVAGCGDRTALDLPLADVRASPENARASPGDAAAVRRGAPDATHDATLDAVSIRDVSLVPDDVPLVHTGCPSALEPGAPAPVAGYCSTQSNVSATRVPVRPAVAWSTQVGASSPPAEVVVDAEGRAYIASCSAPGEPEDGAEVECQTLVALDPDGSVAWTRTFDGVVRGLFLAADGTLHVASSVPSALYTVDAHGEPTLLGTLPDDVSYGYVGSDGSLYGDSIDYAGTDPDRIVKMTAEGTILWSVPVPCHDCIETMALTPDDSVVAALAVPGGDGGLIGSVIELDANGSLAWTQSGLPGYAAELLAVAMDGSIRVVEGVPDRAPNDAGGPMETTVLVSLSKAGDVLWQTDVRQDPEQTEADPLVVLNDGTTIFRSFTHLNAVDATGRLLWSTKLACPNCAYAAAADPEGGLLALLGDVEGIDVATGDVLWSGIAAPEDGGTRYFLSTLVLGPPGVLFGATFGGELFAASDR